MNDKRRLTKEVFMCYLEELYKEKEVYPNHDDIDYEPYPFEMWLNDTYELIFIASKY